MLASGNAATFLSRALMKLAEDNAEKRRYDAQQKLDANHYAASEAARRKQEAWTDTENEARILAMPGMKPADFDPVRTSPMMAAPDPAPGPSDALTLPVNFAQALIRLGPNGAADPRSRVDTPTGKSFVYEAPAPKAAPPVRGTPEYLRMLDQEQSVLDRHQGSRTPPKAPKPPEDPTLAGQARIQAAKLVQHYGDAKTALTHLEKMRQTGRMTPKGALVYNLIASQATSAASDVNLPPGR